MSNFNPYQPSQPPQPPYGAPQKPQSPMGKPKNYLVESILLFCCCGGVFAIPAIIYAAQVDSKYNAGDHQAAWENSANAKKWCIIALCIGLFCNVTVGGLQLLMIAADA